MLEKKQLPNSILFAHLPVNFFIPVALITVIAVFMGKLPKGMIGAFAAMMVIGAVMEKIGDKTPIIKDYLGGAPIVAIFGTALLVYFNIMPQATNEIITNFMKGGALMLIIASFLLPIIA